MMKRWLLGVAVAFLLVSSCGGGGSTAQSPPPPPPPLTGWYDLGGELNAVVGRSGGWAYLSELSGSPVAIWEEYDESALVYRVYSKRWISGAWQTLGSGPESGAMNDNVLRSASAPYLFLGDQFLYATLKEKDANDVEQASVKRWDPAGGAWVPVGPSLNVLPDHTSFDPVGVFFEGTPVVAVNSTDGVSVSRKVYVRRLNGATWENVGAPLSGAPDEIASRQFLVSTPGKLHVAWKETKPVGSGGYAASWDNVSGWSPLAEWADPGASGIDRHYLAASPASELYLSSVEKIGFQTYVLVKRWNPAADPPEWEPVGSAVNDNVETNRATVSQVRFVGGAPWVAFSEDRGDVPAIAVKRWDGAVGAWVPVGGVVNPDPARAARDPQMAVISGVVHLVGLQDSATDPPYQEVFVRFWQP